MPGSIAVGSGSSRLQSAVPVDGPRTDRAVGHQPDIVAKHMYRESAATPAKTYVGQIGKVDFGAMATCQVAIANAQNTPAATPHAADRPACPSSFATCSDYRRANRALTKIDFGGFVDQLLALGRWPRSLPFGVRSGLTGRATHTAHPCETAFPVGRRVRGDRMSGRRRFRRQAHLVALGRRDLRPSVHGVPCSAPTIQCYLRRRIPPGPGQPSDVGVGMEQLYRPGKRPHHVEQRPVSRKRQLGPSHASSAAHCRTPVVDRSTEYTCGSVKDHSARPACRWTASLASLRCLGSQCCLLVLIPKRANQSPGRSCPIDDRAVQSVRQVPDDPIAQLTDKVVAHLDGDLLCGGRPRYTKRS